MCLSAGAVSAVPPSTSARKHTPDKLTLRAVSDTPILMYGKRSLTLNLGLRRNFQWQFVVTDMQGQSSEQTSFDTSAS